MIGVDVMVLHPSPQAPAIGGGGEWREAGSCGDRDQRMEAARYPSYSCLLSLEKINRWISQHTSEHTDWREAVGAGVGKAGDRICACNPQAAVALWFVPAGVGDQVPSTT